MARKGQITVSQFNPVAIEAGIDAEDAAPGELDAWLRGERRIEAWPDKAKRQIAALEERVVHLEACVHQLLNREQVQQAAMGERRRAAVAKISMRLLLQTPVDAIASLFQSLDAPQADLDLDLWLANVRAWQDLVGNEARSIDAEGVDDCA